MKITIISGGSGNDKLIRGLKKLYNDCDIKVIVNAYDSGKSTGICRCITNTLGVSDIRKNHSRMYEATAPIVNKSILEFYNGRYNLTPGSELQSVLDLLDKWNLKLFKDTAKSFFNRCHLLKNYKFNDFNIANIIYSEMYSEIGYTETNKFFADFLGIDDFVILNSFDNVYLKAVTESGRIIDDEGYIVDHKDRKDKIKSIFYGSAQSKGITTLNKVAIDRIRESDLILISTGTFWSSIYPTLHYGDFYKHINESKAKKFWIMNNEEDKDSYGVGSNDFIDIVNNLGLNLNSFTIIENLDACNSLNQINNKFNIHYDFLGNVDCKHNSEKLSKCIFRLYYGMCSYNRYDKILIDFDDTIWSRNYNTDEKSHKVSIENINLIDKHLCTNTSIISGNTFDSICKKLTEVFGSAECSSKIPIWADSNSMKFFVGSQVPADYIDSLIIDIEDKKEIYKFLHHLGLNFTVNNDSLTSNIKIKPLSNLERRLLSGYLNDYLFRDKLDKYIAKPTGTTTVDIVTKNNNKSSVFNYLNLKDSVTLYIGDEIDNGNDLEISKLCTNYIKVKDVFETNLVLRLLIGD